MYYRGYLNGRGTYRRLYDTDYADAPPRIEGKPKRELQGYYNAPQQQQEGSPTATAESPQAMPTTPTTTTQTPTDDPTRNDQDNGALTSQHDQYPALAASIAENNTQEQRDRMTRQLYVDETQMEETLRRYIKMTVAAAENDDDLTEELVTLLRPQLSDRSCITPQYLHDHFDDDENAW